MTVWSTDPSGASSASSAVDSGTEREPTATLTIAGSTRAATPASSPAAGAAERRPGPFARPGRVPSGFPAVSDAVVATPAPLTRYPSSSVMVR
ncbi:hypothetical protein [Streptosporangium sp. NBC_01469]|uniref:hypothetical protein n=1 Tax=Streptosporangium sp. NBC_01469 TaxID=2903898 RepID=UPI002E2A19A2|nr:hypothetical protein [Streptosporangium sp. NBC_01469]